MPGDSLNLVEMIRGYLTSNTISRMSSFMGEDTEKTRAGIHAAVPGLLGGLDRAASTPDGLRNITAAVDDADENQLDNPLGALDKSFSADSSSGILSSILGAAGLAALANNVGRSSGLSSRGASSMLALLAPIVLGVLKRVRRMAGSGRFDLADLLASQRSHIAAEETHAHRFGTRERVETHTTAEAPHKRNWAAWILPLALLAGGLWLLSNWMGRPRQAAFVPPSKVEAGREESAARARTVLTLEQLKTKYRSVLREAETQGIKISDLREQNGKLVIAGTAPSQAAADNFMSAVRRANPALDEISADIQVVQASSTDTHPSETQSSNREKAGTDMPARSEGQTYTVKRGDTLGSISKQFYGNTKDYTRILNANQDKIENANQIEVGQELSIP
jgi:LysM repeat protein